MMRSITPITVALMSVLLILPLSLSAQDAGTAEGSPGTATVREAGTGKATGRLNGPSLDVQTSEKRASTTGTRTITPRAEDVRQKVLEKRGEILKRFALKMVDRMNAAINRLSKLADRLESRIAKEKARGVNTDAAEANLAAARTKLADARTAVADAKAAILEAMATLDVSASNAKPIDAGKPVRDELQKAKDAVFAAHRALVQAIASLKGTRVINPGTTTTSTTTVQ